MSPGHPSKNPRLVKEADAFAEAGYDVHVVAGDYHPWGHEADRQYKNRAWTLERVSYGPMAPSLRRTYLGGRKRTAEMLADFLPYGMRSLNLRAHHWIIPELIERGRSVPADLFIAHYLPALPAAFQAAKEQGAKVGFDAEDFHRGQFHREEWETPKACRTRWFEEMYIPRCDFVTAASPGIAQAYAEALGIEDPTTILNVFPLSERSGHTPPGELQEEHPGDGLSLYWYSQTIGPDRGLDMIVQAMGHVRNRHGNVPRLTLSLRGTWVGGYAEELRVLAQSAGLESSQIRHLPIAPPEQLIERAAQHDIGLALEQATSVNRDICITNKIFAYVLAGLPVLATDTQGQQFVQRHAPEAVRLCPVGNSDAMAQELIPWVERPDERRRASNAASQVAENRFNWDVEKERLLAVIQEETNFQVS